MQPPAGRSVAELLTMPARPGSERDADSAWCRAVEPARRAVTAATGCGQRPGDPGRVGGAMRNRSASWGDAAGRSASNPMADEREAMRCVGP